MLDAAEPSGEAFLVVSAAHVGPSISNFRGDPCMAGIPLSSGRG